METDRLQQLSAALLAAWKTAGHPIGVDTHLRVQRLLKELPENTDPAALKTLLSPLLCKDKEEQKQFYELFAFVLEGLPQERPRRVMPKLKWWWLLVPLLLSGIFFGLRHCGSQTPDPPTQETLPPIQLQMGDPEQPLWMGADSVRYKMPPVLRWREYVGIDNSTENCLKIWPIKVGRDSLKIQYVPRDAATPKKEVTLIVIVSQAPKGADSLPEAQLRFDFKPYKHSTPISTLVPRSGPQFSLIKSEQGGLPWIVKTGWLVSLVTLLLLMELFRNLVRFKKPEPEEEKKKSGTDDSSYDKMPNSKGPFSWQLKVPGIDRFALEDQASYIIQMLRRRSEQDALVFDVPKTVHANIRKPGLISFQYRNPTQIDEYLLLIDIRSRNDHRAQVFDLLYREFSREEVLAERFFYDGDLRLVWNEKYPNGLGLRDLQHKFGQHRLMIVGSGESLFSPVTGRMERWTETFDQWQHRSFLSTIPIPHWRTQEVELDVKFRMAPATLNGLSWLVGSDAAPEDRDIDYWKSQPDARLEPLRISDSLSEEAIFATLDAEFSRYLDRKPDDRMLRWIAACAISPVLHWDATLFFGRLVDDNPHYPLLSIGSLQELSDLEWFQNGRMPEKVRRVLLRYLEREQPEQLLALRSAWQKLLEENLAALQQSARERKQNPFEQSVAYEELRLQMVVNELALDKLQNKAMPLEKRKNLKEELDNLSHRAPADFVALELLRESDPVEINVEERAEEEKQDQLPALLRGWRWQLPLFLMCALNFWVFDGIGTRCTGTDVAYGPYPHLCLKSISDQAALTEQIICDAIDFDTAHLISRWPDRAIFSNALPRELAFSGAASDSVFRIARIVTPPKDFFDKLHQERIDNSSAYRNIGTALWNAGLQYYNRGQRDSACQYFSQLLDWPQRDSVLSAAEMAGIGVLCAQKVLAPVPKPAKKSPRVLEKPKTISLQKTRVIPTTLPPVEKTQSLPGSSARKDSLKPIVIGNPNEEAPNAESRSNFTFSVDALRLVGKVKADRRNLISLNFISTERTVQDNYLNKFRATKDFGQKKSILVDYMKSLLEEAVTVPVYEEDTNKNSPGDSYQGFRYTSPQIPDQLSYNVGIFEKGKFDQEKWMADLLNSRNLSDLVGGFEKQAYSINALEFENQVIDFLLKNYDAGSRSGLLGFYHSNMNRAEDYPFGNGGKRAKKDVYNIFSLDYSMRTVSAVSNVKKN